MEKGHYGQYSGNSRHSRVTSHNMAATKRDDEAHMKYLKEDIKYDNKHGHSDIDMTADEKHISKLAGDLKYDEKHHGSARTVEQLNAKKQEMQETNAHKKMGVKAYNKKIGRLNKKIERKTGAAQHHGESGPNSGDIKESPGTLTELSRRLRYDQTGGYAMARNLGTTMLALAPIPSFGKYNAFKKIASALRNAPKQYTKGLSNLAKGGKSIPEKNIGGFREFANRDLRDHFNPTNKRTTSIPNPIPESTKTYNKLQYPMGKKAFSQPVDFKGPNPANNIGAGGNSYPK